MKRLVIGLAIAGGLYAQSGAVSNSVYATLFQNVTAATISSNVLNAGQVGHQVNLQFSNAPTMTCGLNNLASAQLEFSYDNVSWKAFGYPTSTSTNSGSLIYTYYGTGAYPYVRFNLVGFDTTNCLATAYYSGGLTNTSTPPIVGSFTIQRPYSNHVLVNGESTTLQNSGQTVHALTNIVVGNAPSQTCAKADNYVITLYGTTGTTGGIGTAIASFVGFGARSIFTGPITGYGAYSALYLLIQQISGAISDCAVTLDYVGTNGQKPAAQSGSTYTPIVQCDTMQPINVTSGTTGYAIHIVDSGINTVYHVCSLALTGSAAGTTATVFTGTTTSTACDTGGVPIGVYTLGTSSVVIGGLGNLFSSPISVCVTATGGGVKGSIGFTAMSN